MPSEPLPILSIRQPFAYLVCEGIKNIENRSWFTDYRGGILIHASKNLDQFHEDCEWVEESYGVVIPKKEVVIGKVIGEVQLTGMICPGSDSFPLSLGTGGLDWWSEDCYGWIFNEADRWARPLQFECRGRPGLFYLA